MTPSRNFLRCHLGGATKLEARLLQSLLQLFLPETAKKIADVFGDDLNSKEVPENYKFIVKKGEPLFPRLS